MEDGREQGSRYVILELGEFRLKRWGEGQEIAVSSQSLDELNDAVIDLKEPFHVL